MATIAGAGLGDLLRGQPDLQTGLARAVLEALAWAGARPLLTWGCAGGALGARAPLAQPASTRIYCAARPIARRRSCGRSRRSLRPAWRPPRNTARLLDGAGPGLLPPPRPSSGAPRPATRSRRAAWSTRPRRLALAAAAQAGPGELAAALREVAGFRLGRLEDRGRVLAAGLGLTMEVGVGLVVLALAVAFLGGGWR
ncbi:MAG: hypothetical protein KF878_31740 [Planctomycetes bacterium]|nr:hypothetical protein [Planctomycetota bacterium]